MATSTTLKLPEELRSRIAPLAKAAGKTPHGWMIEALEAQASLDELRQSFLREAEQSAREIDQGGALYAMESVHDYIAELAAGRKPRRPAASKAMRKSASAAR